MPLDLVRLPAGILLLYFGAEWLVRGSAGFAFAMGMRPLVVGLTIVAYGTSAPELVVSVAAALEGHSALALGNVVGSNIANLGLILGVTALISPPAVEKTLARREVPILVVTALLCPFLLADGWIGRVDGALLLLGAIAFTIWTLRVAAPAPPPSAESGGGEGRTSRASLLRLIGLAALGLAVLLAGGKVFVDGATGVALAFGVSERLIGLTIVAIGTSLPEMAASLVAAIRGHPSIAVGNVVGSNIFNMLLILGAAGLVRPIEGSFSVIGFDVGVMVGFTLAGALLLRCERRISRLEGALLVAAYAAFLITLTRME